jgi:hypothetical protein
MTLLDDLRALDVSVIVDAKAEISVAIDVEELQNLIGDGAVTQVLGDLGTLINEVRAGVDDPAVLLAPLLDALGELPDLLGLDELPLGDYVEAVRSGAEVLAALLAGMNGDLAPVGELLGRVGGPISDFTATTLGEVGRFRALVDTVESGLPTDPEALADLAVELLLPFPRPALGEVRRQVDALIAGMTAIELRAGALTGLIAALVDVRVAADAGDAAAVRQAIDRLARLGDEAVASLGDALRLAAQQIGSLRVDLGLGAIADLSVLIRSTETDAVGFLERFRGVVVEMRAMVAGITAATFTTEVTAMLDLVEAEARTRFDQAVDAQIRRLADFLRGLFAELGLGELRATVSDAIHAAARAIADAGLDRVSAEIRGAIAPLRDLVADADLAGIVAAAKARIVGALDSAFDQIESSIGVITARIEELATDAQAVLARGIEALRTFRTAIDDITVLIDELNVEGLTSQAIHNLRTLREAAEEIVSVVPVPEQLQPVIDQLIATIESVDLDAAIGEPLRAAASRLTLPEELGADIHAALETVAEIVSSLIPTEVIAELEAQMNDMIAAVGDLDLAPLTAGITDVLDDVAGFLDELDITAAVAPVGAAFDQMLALIDRVHPRLLLAPLINVYDSLLGQLPAPDGATLTRRVAQVTSAAGEAAARGAAAPVQRLAPAGSQLAPPTPAGAAPGEDHGVPVAPVEPAFRAGDIVRLLGFFPAKVHEALAALDAAGAGTAVAAIDRMCRGLAADLRRIRTELVALPRRLEQQLDAQLRALATAQVDAQLALRGGVTLTSGGVDVDASVSVVAAVGAAGIRNRLAAELALLGERGETAVAAASGSTAAALESMAGQLERCSLGGVLDDAESLLTALDVEPIAAEIDALVLDALTRAPELLAAAEAQILDVGRRIQALIQEFNPGAQAHRLLVLLDVIREQFDLLNPERLAAELAEVHTAIRSIVAAYDPRLLAADLDALVNEAAAAIRALDPATLIGDFSAIEAQLTRLPALVPTAALSGVGASLAAIGEELTAIDVAALFDSIETLAPQVADAIASAVTALQAEIVALLKSIRYAQVSGEATASVSVG